MLFCFQLFLFILQVYAESNEMSTQSPTNIPTLNLHNILTNTTLCVLPEQPYNGYYKLIGDMNKIGDYIYSFKLQVSCNRGYFLTVDSFVNCDNGLMDVMPECVPYCKKSNPQLIACSTDNETQSRCLIPLVPDTNDTFPWEQTSELTTRGGTGLKCGRVRQATAVSIAGGRWFAKYETPWHVGVYKNTTQHYTQICGGTLITKQLVISAASCFWDETTNKQQPRSLYAVGAGKYFRTYEALYDKYAQYSHVHEIRIPPRYQGAATSFQDDIALVFTTTAFELNNFVTTVCLDFDYNFDTAQLDSNRKGKLPGWGFTNDESKISETPRVVELPSIEIERCIAISESDVATITSDKICAGYTNNTALCRSDIGGGFVVPELLDYSVHYFLRGVLSTAPRSDRLCDVYTAPRFTRIISHERFIRTAISHSLTQESVGDPKPKLNMLNIPNNINLFPIDDMTFTTDDSDDDNVIHI